MKNRTPRYLGTFVNNAEGNSSYRLMIHHIRQVVKGGRFVKMFRGGRRNRMLVTNRLGNSLKDNSTHFDVYFHGNPTFYGFKLVPNRPW
jgi:hypothetical protein